MLLYPKGEGVLRERFEAALRYTDRVDVLVGFFWFSGLKVFEDALRANPGVRMRVLVGMAGEVFRGQVVEVAPETEGKDDSTVAAEAYDRLEAALRSGALERQSKVARQNAARQAFFAGLLAAGRIEVRQTRRPNHAKVWLFHTAPEHAAGLGAGRLITGSSNFSRAALKEGFQDELDVELMDWGYPEAQAWFDALWGEAVPLDGAELSRRLAARAPLTPFEAFALALDTVVRADPGDAGQAARIRRALREAGFREFAYQRDAVVQACAMLEAYNGVLVADVVGLGKSVIAMLIAATAGFAHTGLILCPPGLVENWEGYRAAFGLGPTNWPIRSSGDLEKVLALLREDGGFQMVIVDEAHRFRNAEGQQYAQLQAICRGRRVVLLTATPLNNRLDDLAALLGLFLPMRGNPLVSGGDLQATLKGLGTRLRACQAALRQAKPMREEESAIQAVDAKTLADAGLDRLQAARLRGRAATRAAIEAQHAKALAAVRDILEKVTIRRNRLDLLEDPVYRASLPPLSRVCDPTPEYYALDDAQDAFYDRVVTEYFGGLAPRWQGPVYQPECYVGLRGRKSGGATQGNIRENMRRLLVRRFESSFAAFARSLENMLAYYRKAEAFAEEHRQFLYARKEMERLAEIDAPDEFQKAYDTVLAELERRRADTGKENRYDFADPDFADTRFMADLRADIALVEGILAEMRRLRLVENDPKSARLVEVCRAVLAGEALRDPDPAAPKRKILIFSEFADTVRFLGERLRAAFPGRVCVVTDLGQRLRAALRADFDASCPKAERRDDADILVGTDKISEGLNLNRAGVVVNYDIPWNPTRVLQRLGRINRIGGKVFGELHTLNFFPTKRGADLVGNARIAREKLFNIQKTLGEDVKLFDEGEEPTAAELWARLNASRETPSPFTKWRGLHAEIARRDPGLFARVRERAPNAKSARAAVPGIPPGTYQLRTLGTLPQALARTPDGDIRPLAPADLLAALHCAPDAPLLREPLRDKPFWDALKALADHRAATAGLHLPTLAGARDTLAAVEQAAPALAGDVRAARLALNEGRLAIWWAKRLNVPAPTRGPPTPADPEAYGKILPALLADLRLAGPAAAQPPPLVTQLTVQLT